MPAAEEKGRNSRPREPGGTPATPSKTASKASPSAPRIERTHASLLLTHHPPEWLYAEARRRFESDLAPSGRLRRLGRIRIVPASVRVSGRRFLARPLWYAFAVTVFPALYAVGVPPGALKRLSGDPR